MTALRLVLVYASACGAALFVVNRWLRRISPAASLALALLPLLLTGRALFTGGYYGPLNISYESAPLKGSAGSAEPRRFRNGILSDVAIYVVPGRKAVREAVRSGHLPLWNRFVLSGDILLAALQPAVLHPVNLLGFLLPLSTALTLSSALLFFSVALCVFLFVREIEISEDVALFSGGAWMLSMSVVFWNGWPLAWAYAPVPFLWVGLRRLAREKPRGFSVTAAALLLIIFAGHPETILHAVAASGLYFLFELYSSNARRKAIGYCVAAGALSLALSAPLLLPFFEALPQTRESAERAARAAAPSHPSSLREAASSAVGAAFPARYGEWLEANPRKPPAFDVAVLASCGSLVFALALLSLFSPRTEKWPMLVLAFLSLSAAVGLPGIAQIVARLPLFKLAVAGRLTFLTSCTLAILSALGLDRLLEVGNLRRAGLASVLLIVLVFLRTMSLPALYPTFPSRAFYPSVEEFTRLPKGGEPYRVAAIGYSLVPNQAALYELEDPRGYEAMTNARYAETYPLWSVPQRDWFNRIDDPTRPFLSFLNTRFLIADPATLVPAGWREFVRGKNCAIFENPRVLPRAFAPARLVFVTGPDRTVDAMSSTSDFSEVAWIEDRGATAGAAVNAPARVSTREEGSDLLLEVHALAPAWIVVSETSWKGWKAKEGPRELPLLRANHAFLAFRVDPGVHRIRLSYWPSSFSVGLWVALCGILTAVLFLWRRRSVARQAAANTPSAPPVEEASAPGPGDKTHWDNLEFTHRLETEVWMASPVVRRYLHSLSTGDPNCDWLTFIRHHHFSGPVGRCLVLGCGTGWLERALAASGQFRSIIACDFAADSVDEARRQAEREAMSLIEYRVLNLEKEELPEGKFDAIVANDVLHHITGLEALYERIHDKLEPGGRFAFCEYIGPNRFQYPDERMELINRYFRVLPARLRRDSFTGELLHERSRIDAAHVIAWDPTEAVRSEEVLPLARSFFEPVAEIPYGGSLLNPLLFAIVKNFREADPEDDAMLQRLCDTERRLLQEGRLSSDFFIFVGKRRSPA